MQARHWHTVGSVQLKPLQMLCTKWWSHSSIAPSLINGLQLKPFWLWSKLYNCSVEQVSPETRAAISGLLAQIAHCTSQSFMWLQYWNRWFPRESRWHTACENLPYQYCILLIDCSVHCAIGTRNIEMAVSSPHSTPQHSRYSSASTPNSSDCSLADLCNGCWSYYTNSWLDVNYALHQSWFDARVDLMQELIWCKSWFDANRVHRK